MGTPQSSLQQAIDKLLRQQGSTLERFLRDARGDGVGFEEISRRLYTEVGVPVSSDSVRRWVHDLPDASTNAGAA